MSTTRIRRGKVVGIPEEWQGKVCHPQTQRKRKVASLMKVVRRRRRLRDDALWDTKQENEI